CGSHLAGDADDFAADGTQSGDQRVHPARHAERLPAQGSAFRRLQRHGPPQLALLERARHRLGLPRVPSELVEQVVQGTERLRILPWDERWIRSVRKTTFGGDAPEYAVQLAHQRCVGGDEAFGGGSYGSEGMAGIETDASTKIAFRRALQYCGDTSDLGIDGARPRRGWGRHCIRYV